MTFLSENPRHHQMVHTVSKTLQSQLRKCWQKTTNARQRLQNPWTWETINFRGRKAKFSIRTTEKILNIRGNWCFFFLRANYKIYTATINVIKSSEILPFLFILFYVIRRRSDKVTVFSFWYCFHSIQNRCKQLHHARGELVCTYWCFTTPPKDDVRQGSSEPQRRTPESPLEGWFPKSGIFQFSVCPIFGETCPNCTWPLPTFQKFVQTGNKPMPSKK